MRPLAILLIAALALSACKRRREPRHDKVTASSSYDATDPLVDEDYRFRLDWPGRGWKVLREQDARKVNPDAVAGLQHADGVGLVVIVESAPGGQLEGFTQLILENFAVEEKFVDQKPTRVGDVPATRVEIRGKLNDARFVCRGLVFIHQDHAYQVLAFALGIDGSDELDAALASFSIVPGEVRRRTAPVAVADQKGVGWRVAGGVFESAASRTRWRPPAGWRLALGTELSNMNTEAEVGMVAIDVEAYLVIVTERVPGVDLDAYAAERRAASFSGATPVDTIRATVLGREVELHRATVDRGVVYELVHGVAVDRDRAFQLIGWYPAAIREQADPALRVALGALESIDDATVAAVAAALEGEPDTQNQVGDGHALRAGTYHDFVHHIRWRKPPGFWRIAVGQAARVGNADAQLSAEEIRSGLFAQLIIEPAAEWDDASFHKVIVENLVTVGFEPGREGTSRMAGAEARFTEGELSVEGMSLRYRVTTAIVGDAAVQAATWSVPAAWPGDDAVAAVAAGVEAAPEPEIDDGRAYRDRRLGFAMSLPPGWVRSDMTPPELRVLGTVQQWRSGLDIVMVVAVFALDQADEEWMLDMLEQKMRDVGAELQGGASETSTGELGGRPARVVRWGDRATVSLIHRDATYYAVIALAERDGSKLASITADSFSLLD